MSEAARRQELGRAAEDIAVDFLRSRGLAIVMRNFKRRAGELDIVARDGEVLVIAEVRTRACDEFGGAAASVGFKKQARLLRAAAQLLQQRKDLAALRVRLDVIVVHAPSSQHPSVEWIKHAFTA